MEFYRGTILNPIDGFNFELIEDGLLVIKKGKILFCGSFNQALLKYPQTKDIKKSIELIIPGLIDLHTHLPQYPSIGKGKGELLPWLNNFIFPQEIKFNNPSFAREVAKIFFKKLIKNGTTTAVLYSNSNLQSTDIVFQEAKQSGIRAFIGLSLMDINTPAELQYSVTANINNMLKLIDKWHLFDFGRLNFIVTPRFAGSCSIKLMKEAAKVAKDHDLYIQTHLSENQQEITHIQSMHDFEHTYTEFLEMVNLLTEKTLLAHGIHLQPKELKIIKDSGSTIIHCPTSNRYLQSGIMPLYKYLKQSLKVGLGTDIAGGFNCSMLNESREAVENSKYYRIFCDKKSKIIEKKNALWISTLGNAKIMNLDSAIGSLSEGKEADFIIFELTSNFFSNYDNLDDILSELLYGDNLKIRDVFIRGKKVNKD